ncbi:hypothetical protein WDU94_006566 [Cyamophila willieti]
MMFDILEPYDMNSTNHQVSLFLHRNTTYNIEPYEMNSMNQVSLFLHRNTTYNIEPYEMNSMNQVSLFLHRNTTYNIEPYEMNSMNQVSLFLHRNTTYNIEPYEMNSMNQVSLFLHRNTTYNIEPYEMNSMNQVSLFLHRNTTYNIEPYEMNSMNQVSLFLHRNTTYNIEPYEMNSMNQVSLFLHRNTTYNIEPYEMNTDVDADLSQDVSLAVSTFDNLRNVFDPFRKQFKCVHINAESLKCHHPTFLESFSNLSLGALLVSETFLRPSIPSSMVSFFGYNLIRNDRLHKKRGGVAIYLRSDFSYSIVAKSDGYVEGSMEFLILEVIVNNNKLLLAVVYRPPDLSKTSFSSDFQNLLSNYIPVYSDIIIMGDMNCNLLEPSTSDIMHTLTDSLSLNILPSGPTFHLPSGYISHLDISLTASLDKVKVCGNMGAPGFSHHDLLYIAYDLRCPKTRGTVVTYRDFANLDIEKLHEDISSSNWDTMYEMQSVNEKVAVFSQTINNLFDKHVPLKQSRMRRPPAPWLTDSIRACMKARDRAHVKFRQTSLRNKCNRLCRDSRRKHIAQNVSEGSPASTWSFLNGLGAGGDKELDQECAVDLDELNTHFTTCPVQLDADTKASTLQRIFSISKPNCTEFKFAEVSSKDVLDVISSIKSNAIGDDGISIKFIKVISCSVVPVLTHIYNASLNSGVFPDKWKCSRVTPLPKVKSPSSVNDYRPISILPALSKVFERLVYVQVNKYLLENSLLNPLQSGFRAGHSTSSALIKVTDDIRGAMDQRKLTLLLLLDFSKAFDSVDHEILIARLSSMNFSQNSLAWFRSYLDNRRQCVKGKEGLISSWTNCLSGVPQGSVLGPLLFSLFINTITDTISCNCHLYADDLQLYMHFPVDSYVDSVNQMNVNLERLRIWVKNHGIVPNPRKFQAIVIGSSPLLAQLDLSSGILQFDGVEIPFSDQVKNLGVIMDKNLSWDLHINNISKKCYYSFHSLKILRRMLPFGIRKMLCTALIMPIIEYAHIVYLNITQELKSKVQRLQNSCVRYVFGLRKYDHVTMCRVSLGWMTTQQRRDIHTLLLLWRVLNTRTPSYLSSMFIPLSRSLHDTRAGNEALLMIPMHRTNFFADSFAVQAVKLWNLLPSYIRTSTHYPSFRRLLLKHIEPQ